MNRWASTAAAAVTVFLSAATVGGVVASQGVFETGEGDGGGQAAVTAQVLDATTAATIADELAIPGASVVVVDREPIVRTRDIVVPDDAPSALTGSRDTGPGDDDGDEDEDDHDDDDRRRDREDEDEDDD